MRLHPALITAASLSLACGTGTAPAPITRSEAITSGSARSHHTATLLTDGRILLAGGREGGTALASVELLDPARGTVQGAAPLEGARSDHTATLLSDGRVLVAGGRDGAGAALATCELWDPVTGIWTSGPALLLARSRHTATRLASGEVLVAGGQDAAGPIPAVERLAADASGWSAAAPLGEARASHDAVLLADDTVLVTGGDGGSGPIATSERYAPGPDAWTPAPALAQARSAHVAIGLADGSVLVAGGEGATGALASAERWGGGAAWSSTGSLGVKRLDAAAVLLPSGRAVVMGGRDGAAEVGEVEIYDPGIGTFSPGAPLADARAGHTATLLPTGRVLVAGGERGGAALAASEVIDLAVPGWAITGPTSSSRRGHTATLLPGGKVLVAGGIDGFGGYLANAQLFDPGTGQWADTGSMLAARTDHTATLLESGEVLVAGGAVGSGTPLAAAELYHPTSGTWSATGALQVARTGHTATLLPSGVVLVVGGEQLALGQPVATPAVELYDPSAGTFAAAGSLSVARVHHTATLLPGGDVLVAGGQDSAGVPLQSCERWSSTGWGWVGATGMAEPRTRHGATVLEDGRVMVTGGSGPAGPLASTELFLAGLGWSPGPSLTEARSEHGAVLLPSGALLVAGGRAAAELASVERWDPWLNAWRALPALSRTRTGLTLTLLPDGTALATGGDAGDRVHVAEVHDDGMGADPTLTPALDGGLPERTPGTPLDVTGSRLAGGPEASGGGVRESAVNHPVLRLEGAAGPVGHLEISAFDPATVTGTVPRGIVPGWYWLRPQVAGAWGTARPILVMGTLRITPPSAGVPPLGEVPFTAAGGIGYAWNLEVNGSGATLDPGSGAYRAGPAGGVTDVVRVTDALGNTATAAVVVGPPLAIGPNPGGADPGGTIAFTASGGSGAGYAWTLVADGSGSALDPVTGVYTAGENRNSADRVRVTDSLGNVAEVTVYVWPEWRLGGEGCNCGSGGRDASPLVLLLGLLAVARPRRRALNLRVLACLALGAVAAPALAQELTTSIVIERFEPLGGTGDVLAVGSADLPGHLERSAGLSFSLARRPLRLAAPGALSYAVVSSQATLWAGASVGLFGVGELSVVGSGSLAQSTERAANVPRGLQPSIAANGFSDVRLVPKVRLGTLGGVRAALAVPVTLPTGRTDSFLGAGAVTWGPRLLLTTDLLGVRVLGSAGYLVRPDRSFLDATIGDAVTYGLAAERSFRLWGRGFAVLASVAGEKGKTSAASPLEALLGLRFSGPRGLGVTVGGGPGISSGYGTPEWRAFAAVSLGALPAPRVDPPAVVEPPPVPVAAIEEPPAPPPAPAARARRVPVAVPLPPPPLLQVDVRVYFGVNESAIPPRFYAELERVAAAVLSNPRPVKLLIEGHADEIGAARHNLRLSELRAERVKEVLRQAGVPADRLRAVGYGDSHPTMPGRHAMNRRVELSVE
jgi:outer membrane protein OmpA-like peptidoglycan-associated protein